MDITDQELVQIPKAAIEQLTEERKKLVDNVEQMLQKTAQISDAYRQLANQKIQIDEEHDKRAEYELKLDNMKTEYELRLNPNDATCLLNRANILMKQHRTDEAIAMLKQLLALNDSNSNAVDLEQAKPILLEVLTDLRKDSHIDQNRVLDYLSQITNVITLELMANICDLKDQSIRVAQALAQIEEEQRRWDEVCRRPDIQQRLKEIEEERLKRLYEKQMDMKKLSIPVAKTLAQPEEEQKKFDKIEHKSDIQQKPHEQSETKLEERVDHAITNNSNVSPIVTHWYDCFAFLWSDNQHAHTPNNNENHELTIVGNNTGNQAL